MGWFIPPDMPETLASAVNPSVIIHRHKINVHIKNTHKMKWSAAPAELKFRFQDVAVYPKLTATAIIFLARTTLRCLFFLSVMEQAVGWDEKCVHCQGP